MRHFFSTVTAADAAYHQIDIYEDLMIFQKFDRSLGEAVVKRLQTHLWYTLPEFVVFALASDRVSDADKQDLAEEILKQPTDKLRPGKVKMAPLTPGATLASRVTDQSPHFFSALGIQTRWLTEPAATWLGIPGFIQFSNWL